MTYYQLKTDDRSNKEWRAILSKDEDLRKGVIQAIDANVKIQDAAPIQMTLINIIRDKAQQREKAFASDLVYWYDDITLNAFKASNGLIISRDLKELLQKFAIGEHAFYAIDFTNTEKTDAKEFYLFHPMTVVADITDYKRSEYELTDYSTQTILKTGVGLYESYTELVKANKAYFEKNIGLKITKRVIHSDLDVVHSFTNNLVVTEKIKNAIESSGIRGVKLKPFNEIVS